MVLGDNVVLEKWGYRVYWGPVFWGPACGERGEVLSLGAWRSGGFQLFILMGEKKRRNGHKLDDQTATDNTKQNLKALFTVEIQLICFFFPEHIW